MYSCFEIKSLSVISFYKDSTIEFQLNFIDYILYFNFFYDF